MRNTIIIIFILLIHSCQMDAQQQLETITLGGGCFWCTEAVFQRVKGVEKVESGYAGGDIANPTYREVSSGLTNHAEVVQISFNPQLISLEKILEVFWKTHDPTTLNRQGADVGTQYRSIIMYHNDEQRKVAEALKEALNREEIWENEIVTEITAYKNYYPAEDYHQNYYNNNPAQGYCQFVIVPKLEKFNKIFSDIKK